MEKEAPKKIHIQPNAHDRWFEGSIPNGLPNGLFVEYTRTDAFIEKAAEWLRNNTLGYVDVSMDFENMKLDKKFFKDFQKAMKGECEKSKAL